MWCPALLYTSVIQNNLNTVCSLVLQIERTLYAGKSLDAIRQLLLLILMQVM